MSIRKTTIQVAAGPGQHITEAIREALILSIQERCIVALTHNDKTVELDAIPLIERAYEQWNIT